MIRWFAHNTVAANLLMAFILIGGVLTLVFNRIPLEVFPEFELDQVNISTTLRGATPASVEEGITIRIEEAIFDLEGIKKLSSRSQEGSSIIQVEVEKGFDSRELLNEIKLRVDSISTLPTDAESPVISIPARVREVISVVISGDLPEAELRQLGEFHRDKMLALKGISKIDFDSARNYEITIQLDPEQLDALGLTFDDISRSINQSSLDLSAGNIKSQQGEILVRTNAQAYSLAEYASIPILTRNNGTTILLGDIAVINDGFDEEKNSKLYNGKPATILDVYRTGDQSSIRLANEIKQYITEQQTRLPNGVSMSYWRDRSKVVKGRLNTLQKSAWQGGLLVILLLTLFLRPSVAIWVSLGILISFMGTILLMPSLGVTLNVVSMFAFILALGIVVDDAIVTGENVYRHMRMGKDSLTAAIEGTYEVATPVTFGVLTTIVAFTPLLLIEGNRGTIFAQIPAIVIPVLLFSLVESKLILPAHLRHVKPLDKPSNNILSRVQQSISLGLEKGITQYYRPLLAIAIYNKTVTLFITIITCFIIGVYVSSGWLKFSFFPRIESEIISSSLTMPSPTPFEITDTHIRHIADKARALQEKYRDEDTGVSVIQNILSTSGGRGSTLGSNVGRVSFEIQPPEERTLDISSSTLSREWRGMIGQIPGSEQLSFRASFGRSGEPIDVQLSGSKLIEIRQLGNDIKSLLNTYDGLFDIQDNLSGGKDEFQLTLKPSAYNLGVSLREIGTQTRHALYGLETQRIQRGRDEISVMLKTPLKNRSSLENLYNLPIRIGNGETVALSQIATITSGTSPSALYRINRFTTMNVTSDAEPGTDLEAIKLDLQEKLDELIISYPAISYEMEGEAKEQKESFGSLFSGMFAVFMAIYILLAIPFKSYGQPLIVMSIIPVGAVGAFLGHILVGENLSIMSYMGMLALIGVVINDSLVLVDYINKERLRGTELMQAVLSAGEKRFRPVLLTSLTTFAGLTPLLLEKSTQAKFLQPMAISLGFGIIFATMITLLVVPVNYLVFEKIKDLLKKVFLKRVAQKI